MSAIDFTYDGKCFTCHPKSKFLIETANGTSSYTLERGFGPTPAEALEFYDGVAAGGNKKKRLTLVTDGKRVVVARHPR
jgi:hypothetical protein